MTGHQVILPALYSFLLLKCIRNHSAAPLGRHQMSIRWPCSGHTTVPILHHGISHPVLVPLTHVTTSSNPLKLLFIQGVVYCRNLHAKCKTSLIQTFWSCCDTCICKCMMHPVSICDPSPSTWHQCSPPGRLILHLHKRVPSRWVVCTPWHRD